MTDRSFPTVEGIIKLHQETIAEHGGVPGIRDRGALEASLARAQHLMAYAENEVSVPDLAAAVCISICRNHPFVDGNKRAAFTALHVVLGRNGMYLDVSDREATKVMMAIAAGSMSEEDFRAWVTANSYVETDEDGADAPA